MVQAGNSTREAGAEYLELQLDERQINYYGSKHTPKLVIDSNTKLFSARIGKMTPKKREEILGYSDDC